MREPIKGVGVLRYPEGALQKAQEASGYICQGTILTLPNSRDSFGAFEWNFHIEGGEFDQMRVERSDSDTPTVINSP